MTVTVDDLLALAGSFARVIDVPDVGKVKCRPLSTSEGLGLAGVDNTERAVLVLWHGLVEPALTREQAEQLVAEAPFGAVNTLAAEILRLSGMTEDAQKSVGAEAPPGGG